MTGTLLAFLRLTVLSGAEISPGDTLLHSGVALHARLGLLRLIQVASFLWRLRRGRLRHRAFIHVRVIILIVIMGFDVNFVGVPMEKTALKFLFLLILDAVSPF